MRIHLIPFYTNLFSLHKPRPHLCLHKTCTAVCLKGCKQTTVVVNISIHIYQNSEDDFQFQFLISTKLSSSMDTHKCEDRAVC